MLYTAAQRTRERESGRLKEKEKWEVVVQNDTPLYTNALLTTTSYLQT